MNEKLTPSAEAVEAMLRDEYPADLLAALSKEGLAEMRGWMEARLESAYPIIRRQIIGECADVIEVMLEHWRHPMQGHAVLSSAKYNLRALLNTPTKEGDDG